MKTMLFMICCAVAIGAVFRTVIRPIFGYVFEASWLKSAPDRTFIAHYRVYCDQHDVSPLVGLLVAAVALTAVWFLWPTARGETTRQVTPYVISCTNDIPIKGWVNLSGDSVASVCLECRANPQDNYLRPRKVSAYCQLRIVDEGKTGTLELGQDFDLEPAASQRIVYTLYLTRGTLRGKGVLHLFLIDRTDFGKERPAPLSNVLDIDVDF